MRVAAETFDCIHAKADGLAHRSPSVAAIRSAAAPGGQAQVRGR
jgi:hypothetical protein